jgi:hypothetical protein
MRSFPPLSLPFLCAALAAAQVSIYQPKNQVIYGGTNLHLTATSTSAAPAFTNAAAYDQTVLNPPAVPNPGIPTNVPIQLQSSGVTSNISIPVNGAFMGISIEMSVANQVCKSSYFFLFEYPDKFPSQWVRTGMHLITSRHSCHAHSDVQ